MNIKPKLKSIIDFLVFIILISIIYVGVGHFIDRFVPINRLSESTVYIVTEFILFAAIALSIAGTQFILYPLRKFFDATQEINVLKQSFASGKWGPDLLLGFSIGAVFMSVTMALAYLSGGYVPDHAVNFNINFGVPLIFFLFVGMAEELIFRGFVFLTCEKGFGTKWSIVITSLLFGYFHMFNKLDGIAEDYKPLCCLFLAIEAGFLLNAAFLIRRSLWIPIGIHWSWNLFETSIFGAKEGQIHFLPSLFTGHYQPGLFLPGFPMGMESSYITVVTGLITGFILMRYAKSNKDRLALEATKGQK